MLFWAARLARAADVSLSSISGDTSLGAVARFMILPGRRRRCGPAIFLCGGGGGAMSRCDIHYARTLVPDAYPLREQLEACTRNLGARRRRYRRPVHGSGIASDSGT